MSFRTVPRRIYCLHLQHWRVGPWVEEGPRCHAWKCGDDRNILGAPPGEPHLCKYGSISVIIPDWASDWKWMRKEPMRENLRYSDEYGWLPLTKRSTVIGCYWPQFIPNIDELIRTSMTTARNRPFCTMSPPGAIERPGPGPLKKLWLTGQRGWGRWCLLVSRVRGHSRGDSWVLFGIRKGHVNPGFANPSGYS